MTDLLNMEKLNCLPQPLCFNGFPVIVICVETGLCQIDVCGLTQNVHFSDYSKIEDDLGNFHSTYDFYND